MTTDAGSPRRRAGMAMEGIPKRPEVRSASADDDETPALTPEQLADIRKRLETRRAELRTSIEERRHQGRDAGREVGDEMDDANTEGVTSMASKLLERDAQLLGEIEHALAKMSDGTYGLCEGTGEPIGFPRLTLRPWARFSIAYQEDLEREERTRGG